VQGGSEWGASFCTLCALPGCHGMDPRVSATAFGLLRPRMTKRWLHLFIATLPFWPWKFSAPPLSSSLTLVAGGDPEEWPDGYRRSCFMVATPG
jgi:hypothetical protein